MMSRVEDSQQLLAYTYEPLQNASSEVRILVLEPSLERLSPVQVSFERVSMFRDEEFHDQFEALSYTWGEPVLIHPVIVGKSHILRITDNLNQALREVRQRTEKRRLWIDALCINQRDDREKSHQIPLMYKIFRSARTVLAWLGAGGKVEKDGLMLLSSLSRWPKEKLEKPEALEKLHETTREENIAAVLNLSWFSRMWIIQEVVFNIDVTLIYGGTMMSWARFSKALSVYKIIRHAMRRSGVVDQQLEAVMMISSLWKLHSMSVDTGRTQSSRLNLLNMLRQFAYYQCSDQRDRIYSLYNMATDMERSWPTNINGGYSLSHVPFEVDYSLNVQDTYHMFALACVQADRIGHLLQAVIERRRSNVPFKWASWVPDWRIMPTFKAPWFTQDELRPDSGPLKCINHDQFKLLLLSKFCCSSASHTLPEGPFVNIDTIGPSVAIADHVDSFLRALMKLYYEVSGTYRIWWVSDTKFFATILALLLALTADMADALEKHLLAYRLSETRSNSWETCSPLRDAILGAMKGKTWFRARMPGNAAVFYGITSSSIQVGDQLLVDSRLVYQATKGSMISAIVMRSTLCGKELSTPPTSPRLPLHSFRVVGSALLSCPIQVRSVGYDDSHLSNYIRPTALFATSDGTLYAQVRFWLE